MYVCVYIYIYIHTHMLESYANLINEVSLLIAAMSIAATFVFRSLEKCWVGKSVSLLCLEPSAP